MVGQVLGRSLADETDAQPEEHALERHLKRRADRPDDILGGLLAQTREGRELLGPQIVEVGNIMDQPVLVEQLDRLLAQPVDVQRLAPDEMDDAPDNLRAAAALVGTIMLGLALVTHQRSAALGAGVDILKGSAVGRTPGELDPGNLGDDFTALFDVDHVAGTDVEKGHLLGIVERGAPHGSTGQLHGLEVGDGRDGPGASDLEIDADEPGERLLGLELISHGPLGRLGGETDFAPLGEAVDLDDDAVGRERQLAPRLVPMGDESVDLGGGTADTAAVGDLETPLAGLLQTLPMGLERKAVARKLVERTIQPTARDHGRLLLLERPGGGVARIGEQRLPGGLALGVDLVERSVRHQHLAANLEERRPITAPQS